LSGLTRSQEGTFSGNPPNANSHWRRLGRLPPGREESSWLLVGPWIFSTSRVIQEAVSCCVFQVPRTAYATAYRDATSCVSVDLGPRASPCPSCSAVEQAPLQPAGGGLQAGAAPSPASCCS